MKRLHELFIHDMESSDAAAPHWTALKELVKRSSGLDPFEQVEDIESKGFRYLQSSQRQPRFEILQGEEPYTVSDGWMPRIQDILPPGAGPVERDIAGCMLDSTPGLGVLIGGMGSGKSTSLRQVMAWLKPEIKFLYVNYDKLSFDAEDPPSANELLVQFLDQQVMGLIGVAEEFKECWNWAFDRAERFGDVIPLQPAARELRLRYEDDWRNTGEEALEYRRTVLYSAVNNSISARINYCAMLVNYHLSVKRGGQRHRLCVVLDNVDPLPPRLQRELLLAASRFQLYAQCHVMVSMRPLTYSLTHEQRAHRTVKVIEHVGPSAIELIEDRITRLVQETQCATQTFRIYRRNGQPEREFTDKEIKAWVLQIMSDIRSSSPSGTGRNSGSRSLEPSASHFIEGLCNNSLRSALLVAEKIFGSRNLKMPLPDDGSPTEVRHTNTLKNHDLIRAVLLGRHEHFVSSQTRVTDNIFDLGDVTGTHSLTAKFRVLKELNCTPGRGILPMDEVVKRMRGFGCADNVILEAVNGVISQIKRLAWSDTMVAYSALDAAPGSRLCISRAGRFYVNHAIYSLEYVQEVHVDVLLPDDLCGASYNHHHFGERIDSVRRFVQLLCKEDLDEVQRVVTAPEARRLYVQAYGATLFSLDVCREMHRQIGNIANSIIRRTQNPARKYQLQESLAAWDSMAATAEHKARPVLENLERSVQK